MRKNTRIHEIVSDDLSRAGNQLFIKRDDELDPMISGNKLYKLDQNLRQAVVEGKRTIVTVGGAFSNHIAATAKACKQEGLASIGIIRGERTSGLNPTLRFAESQGMKLEFRSRSAFRSSRQQGFQDFSTAFPDAYFIPEGGANQLGVEGATAMYSEECRAFDVLCVAMGTGTTFAGILKALQPGQQLIGFPVLKNDHILDEISPFLSPEDLTKRHEINTDYHFGGYAKWNETLISFLREFWIQHSIKLDPIYTGKLLYGVSELVALKKLEGKRILCFHTGGIQGVSGFEERFGIKIF